MLEIALYHCNSAMWYCNCQLEGISRLRNVIDELQSMNRGGFQILLLNRMLGFGSEQPIAWRCYNCKHRVCIQPPKDVANENPQSA